MLHDSFARYTMGMMLDGVDELRAVAAANLTTSSRAEVDRRRLSVGFGG